jgi:hypothetical protein
MSDEITFHNDPVDPSVEFRKQHNHLFVAERAERCVRFRVAVRPGELGNTASPMLERCEPGEPWEREDDRERCTWRSEHGSISVRRDPWAVELRNAVGRLLTGTHHHAEPPGVVNVNPMALCFVRSSSTFHRHVAAGLLLAPGERLYGGGESSGDPGSWLVEDRYLLGTGLLMAPLFEAAAERAVYLPPGR